MQYDEKTRHSIYLDSTAEAIARGHGVKVNTDLESHGRDGKKSNMAALVAGRSSKIPEERNRDQDGRSCKNMNKIRLSETGTRLPTKEAPMQKSLPPATCISSDSAIVKMEVGSVNLSIAVKILTDPYEVLSKNN
jgi:hypothetical protein